MQLKIVLLSGKGKFAPFIYNGLKDMHPIEKVIIEEDEPEELKLNRRRKKLGYLKVKGQQLFNKYIVSNLMQTSKARIREIIQQEGLQSFPIPENKKINIQSVNDTTTIELLNEIGPDLIIVNGTRILSKQLLQEVPALFINLHSGITPEYRGSGGGAYWALVNGEPHKCGSTIHLVDTGIDTGAILAQDIIQPAGQDNYLTYVFLNVAKEIELVKKVIDAIIAGTIAPKKPEGTSKIWYEPTIWEYGYNRLVKKVK